MRLVPGDSGIAHRGRGFPAPARAGASPAYPETAHEVVRHTLLAARPAWSRTIGQGRDGVAAVLVDLQRLFPPVGRGRAARRQPHWGGAVRTSGFRPSMRRFLPGAKGRSTTIGIGSAGLGPTEYEGSGHAGCGFLEGSGPSASGGRIDLLKTLKIGIASYGHMKARTMAIARGELTPAKVEPNTWFALIDSIARLLYERYRQLLELIARDRTRPLKQLADPAVCVTAESPARRVQPSLFPEGRWCCSEPRPSPADPPRRLASRRRTRLRRGPCQAPGR